MSLLGETERLLLRTPEEGDLDLIAELWADPTGAGVTQRRPPAWS